jgi:hypothetical protein
MTNRTALKRLGLRRAEAFLRAARRDDVHCLAVKLANEWLDQGATLSTIFQESEGYSISARELSPRQFEIHFGCTPGPMLGDGGSWIVEFDESGAVRRCEGQEVWIS